MPAKIDLSPFTRGHVRDCRTWLYERADFPRSVVAAWRCRPRHVPRGAGFDW